MLETFSYILKSETEKQLKKFGSFWVGQLKEQHKAAGQVASGNTLKSFKFDLIEVDGEFLLQIEGASYIEHLERGRGTGKQSPTEQIEQWLKDKGLVNKWNLNKEYKIKGTAFAIAKKHAEQGSFQHRTGKTWNGATKPVSSAFKDEQLKNLADQLKATFVQRIKLNIETQYKP